jgi:plastocyanin
MNGKLTLRPSLPALALLAIGSVGLAACGDDDGHNEPQATATKVTVTASEAGKRSRLSVPKSAPAGLVTIELTNTGNAFHEAQLIRLDGNHTPEEALKVITAEGAPDADWIHAAGGTGPAPPGGSNTATQRLQPGRYMIYDAPFQNQGQDLKFGVASFEVEGEAGRGELPSEPATVEAYEYGFRASGLKTGKNTIEFSNNGSEPHHVIAAPYKPGATLAAVREAFGRGQGGPEPPLDFDNTSYTARIEGGTKQVTELHLDKPGKYALLCFVSDRKGGPPHVAKGMITEATVP